MGGHRGRLISDQDRLQVLSLIDQAIASGARISACCSLLGISERTIERYKRQRCKSIDHCRDKRSDHRSVPPKNKLSQEEQTLILSVVNSEKYRDLSVVKIVPMLADEGCYLASESTFYRLLRLTNQLKHRHRSNPKKHHKPKSLTAYEANQVWSWDITYLPSMLGGCFYYLYMIMDIFSRKIVGWSIHETESSSHASALITQACLDEKVDKDQLTLHSDNGAPMKGLTMRATLEKLGVLPSFSRPSVSDDNPFSESLFKTVKYSHPTFAPITRFETITQARIWCEQFVTWYNQDHLHSGLKFVTPNQRHDGHDTQILAKRHMVYQMAKKQRPDRWSGATKNWNPDDCVTLNPDKKIHSTHMRKRSKNEQQII